jgi:hypothetical protein
MDYLRWRELHVQTTVHEFIPTRTGVDQWYSTSAANVKIKQEDQQVGFQAYRWVEVLRHVHPRMTGAGLEGAISGQEVTCFL